MTTTTRQRLAAATSGLALAAALTACSPADEAATEPTVAEESASAGETDTAAEHNAADTRFAQMMIVHHEGALEMAELAVERASTDEVRELAERIADAQGPEIETMSGWLDAWGEEQPADAGHGGMDHGGMEMEGMSQEEAMASLSELEGADFDRSFLDLMTAHHRGAVEMAETLRDEGQSAEARDLAAQIVSDQTREIAEMEELLEGL